MRMAGRRTLRFVRTCSLSLALSLGTGLCFAQGASLDAATAAQKKAAQKAFLKGAKAAGKGKHEEALTGFKASYDAVASPNSHLMYARELVALERYVEAYQEFEKIIPEAEAAASIDKKYQQAADAARADMTELEAKIALVTVTGAGEGDIIRVQGQEVAKERWGQPVAVMPGSVKVELVKSSGEETSKEVDAAAGASVDVDMTPETAAPPTETPKEETAVSTDSSKWDKRTWAYVAGGVGVAGIVTFGVFGALANSKHSKLEDECGSGACPGSLEGDRDTGQTYQTVANVGLVVGIVGLGAGTALYLMSDEKSEKQARKKPPPKPRVDVGVGYQSVTVFGTF